MYRIKPKGGPRRNCLLQVEKHLCEADCCYHWTDQLCQTRLCSIRCFLDQGTADFGRFQFLMSWIARLTGRNRAALRWVRPAAPTAALRRFSVQRAGEHQNSVHNIGAGPGAQDMDLAAWSRLKNSEVGEAISVRLTELKAWRPNPQPKFQVQHVPGLTPGVPAAVVQGVLSEKECKELIAGFPSGGQGYMPGQRVAELYRDRKVKSRSLVNDELLARILQERLREVLPSELDGGKLLSVNPNFRFVHYDTGGRHSTHIDGREPVMPRWDEVAEGWVQSRLTMQIYLNSHGKDFKGGMLGLCRLKFAVNY